MRLGIDFGTTRIVVAAVDRGNYPVVAFETPLGDRKEWFPSLVAMRDGRFLFGWQAWASQEDPEATIVGSLKRFLPEAGPQTQVDIDGQHAPMLDLLTGLAASLREALVEALPKAKIEDPFEVILGVPANANGNQRFLTAEAFRRAGFEIQGLLNEPSAASIEFGHSLREDVKAQELIAVYDLGGGTFDASLVEVAEQRHEVLANEGIPALGGDDFDEILADLALEAAEIDDSSLTQAEMFRLHEEAREKKEVLAPTSRRLQVDLDRVRQGWPVAVVPVADFYARSQPLIDETIHAVEDLLVGQQDRVSTIYVTGGGSDLPMVARALKERFGRKVKRSQYARSATAIGLAIRADAQAGYQLREKFTRNFGVWREADSGRSVIFDPLFLKGTPLPAPGDPVLSVTRQYYPAHNIGHFRYLECSHTSSDGRPAGEVMIWDEILFPFDPALRQRFDLAKLEVVRLDWAPPQEVEEKYECDSSGTVAVTISNRTTGDHRSFRLGRWSVPEAPISPTRKRRAPAKKAATKRTAKG
jgi:molecular chaperone DnaK (HSP70)